MLPFYGNAFGKNIDGNMPTMKKRVNRTEQDIISENKIGCFGKPDLWGGKPLAQNGLDDENDNQRNDRPLNNPADPLIAGVDPFCD